VPEWLPFIGEEKCTLSAGIGQGRIDWEAGNRAVQAIAEPVVQFGTAVYQDITRSPQQRLDDFVGQVATHNPLTPILTGDPLGISIGPLNVREELAKGQGIWQGIMGLGSDLTCGDPYRFLRGLATIELQLLFAKGAKIAFGRMKGTFDTRFIKNKAIRLTGLSEADIDSVLLRGGWQKGQQTGGFNAGEPLWWKVVDGVRHEVRLHPHASTNPNLPASAAAKHGGVSRYGIQLVEVELDASGRAPDPGSPKLRQVYKMDEALRLKYGDAPTTMPRYGFHYLDPYGYAYVDEAGVLTPVAANASHFPIKGHPWVPSDPK
jgi:hypothetical protein